jgi:myo-inositol 2-dehydrogenase/D-chiro-inositol 1-dehydrogenase
MVLEMGVPIFCEKPVAMTLDECESLVGAAECAGVPLQVGFQRRFDAGYADAKQRITAEAIGELYSMRLISHDHTPPPQSYMPTSGGLFRDLGVHDFDIARWLTGEEVSEVHTVATNRSAYGYIGEHGDVDVAVVALKMSGGLPVVVSLAWHNGAGHDVRAEITGSKDTLAVGYDSRVALHRVGFRPSRGVDEPQERPYVDYVDRFEAALATQTMSFIDMVAGESVNPCPGIDGVEALRIAVAAERSLIEHRPVGMTELSG